jgi:hypothetical protein
MKVEKFNEMNKNISKFFDACEFQVSVHDNDETTMLKVVDKQNNGYRIIVEIYFTNSIDVNTTNKGFNTLELNLSYDYSTYDKDNLNSAELSAVKSIIKMYKNA